MCTTVHMSPAMDGKHPSCQSALQGLRSNQEFRQTLLLSPWFHSCGFGVAAPAGWMPVAAEAGSVMAETCEPLGVWHGWGLYPVMHGLASSTVEACNGHQRFSPLPIAEACPRSSSGSSSSSSSCNASSHRRVAKSVVAAQKASVVMRRMEMRRQMAGDRARQQQQQPRRRYGVPVRPGYRLSIHQLSPM